jgi:hypothetical protein
MKIKQDNLVIDQENPFSNCALEREQYARVLTSIVNNYAEGFVLAINNEWGQVRPRLFVCGSSN